MSSWPTIASTETDPDSPITTGLMGDLATRGDLLHDSFFTVRKASTQTDAAGGGMVNDSDFVWALGSDEIWYFRMMLVVTTDAAAADLDIDWSLPAGATIYATYTAYVAGALFAQGYTAFAAALNIGYVAAVTNEPVYLEGSIDTAGVAGNAQFRWYNSGGGGNTSLTLASVMHARQQKDTL